MKRHADGLLSTTARAGTTRLLLACLLSAGAALAAAQDRSDGWQIESDALDLTNPVTLTPTVVMNGVRIYRSKCQRCHGTTGAGGGPDADADNPPGDLTDARRAVRNPDGVLFYKIWNGRSRPRMPAFKSELSPEDVWTVIYYIKTLGGTD